MGLLKFVNLKKIIIHKIRILDLWCPFTQHSFRWSNHCAYLRMDGQVELTCMVAYRDDLLVTRRRPIQVVLTVPGVDQLR